MFLQHQSSLFRERYYDGQCLLLKSSKKVILYLNLRTVCLVLSSSIHLLFILFSGLTPTCSLDSLPDEVILEILSRLSLHQVLCTVAQVSKRFYRLSHHSSLWRIFEHDIWFTKRSFENTIIQHALHFRKLTIHSCLRDLRNETSLDYIAYGIRQCINLRKLDISFLKCLRDVSFTKDMLHLEELCIDQCQNISPDSALQGLQGHPNLEKLSMNLCFQFKSYQLQQLCVSAKKLKYFSAERCSQISAATGRKMLEQSSNLTFFLVTPIASVNNFTEWNSILRDFHDTSFGNDLLFLHRVTDQFL